MIYKITNCDVHDDHVVIRVENVNKPNWFVELTLTSSDVVNIINNPPKSKEDERHNE